MEVASHFRSASVESLSHATEVQDAHTQTGRVSDQVRGLVCHDRSKRCILPRLHPSHSQEVPEVCFQGQSIPILGSSLWPCTLTPHFHEVCGFCSGSSVTPGHPHTELHRRLVDSSSIRAIGDSISRCRSHPHERAGVKTKRQEKQFQKLLGLMAAASNVIPLGLLYMRPLKWWLRTKGFSPRGKPLSMIKVTRRCLRALSPVQTTQYFLSTTQYFLSVTTVTVSDYAILTHKILSCREQKTCQTIRCYPNIHRMPSLTTCMMSSDETEGAMSVNKQWLANSVFCPVLSSENPKKERKPYNGHKPGWHEEDGMDCQRELR